MVERMTGPKRMSANALAQEVGVHQPTLSRWLREAATVGDVSKRKPNDEQKRIKDLERELKRKEAALAETAALLVLRKKAGALWGGVTAHPR